MLLSHYCGGGIDSWLDMNVVEFSEYVGIVGELLKNG